MSQHHAAKHTTPEHPWVSLDNPQDIEGWMELNNGELQKMLALEAERGSGPGPGSGYGASSGHGVCFSLLDGGEIFLHTNSEGVILLDVTPEAQWVAPVIAAATRTPAPRGQIWILPQDVMVMLILGLNSLIVSSRLVLSHTYRGCNY